MNKINLFLRKPILVIIFGEEKEKIKKFVFEILKKYFVTNKDVLVFDFNENKINEIPFLFNNSKKPILVINSLNQKILFNNLPPLTYFVLNYDDQKTKEIKVFDKDKNIKISLNENYDIFVSDIKESETTNFKINYKGSVVPFWFKKQLNQKETRVVLMVIGIAIFLGLNLVQISQFFKEIDF